ncbi:MAG: helix-turn-helix transcriptional regulator [Planctomycetes bacterium]|nr:helix-turn-helix transcriptional regulator [Planctomycetota bacterium]
MKRVDGDIESEFDRCVHRAVPILVKSHTDAKVCDMKLSATLRRAIIRSGLSGYRLAQECGVSQGQLSRFLRAERTLSLDAVDRLAAYLKLELAPRKRATRKGR